MAEKKKAKTGEKAGRELQRKRTCPTCNSDTNVVRYTGFGQKGLFWVCEKNCGFMERTH